MGFALNPTYAEPENSSPASKKRVWEIFSESGEFASGNRLVRKCLRGKNASTATKTASGRTVWLSRDPIAENGGINLYGYVDNNPINYSDPLGLIGNPASPDSVSQSFWQAMARGSFDEALNILRAAKDVGRLTPKRAEALEKGIAECAKHAKELKRLSKLSQKELPKRIKKLEKTLEDHMKKRGGEDSTETIRIRQQLEFMKNRLK